MYRDEISRKDLKFQLKAQSLGIGSDGGSTGGGSTTLGSVATLPLMTEEQIEAVGRAITSWGPDFGVGEYFIPATSVDELPLYYKTVGSGLITVATLIGVGEFNDLVTTAYFIPPREAKTFVRVDGGYGEYNQNVS